MHVADGIHIPHHPGHRAVDARYFGWLAAGVPYRSEPPIPFLTDFFTAFASKPSCLTRGHHLCPFCGLDDPVQGNGIHLFSTRSGKHWVAPALVRHYVLDHAYVPPDEVLDAIKLGDFRVSIPDSTWSSPEDRWEMGETFQCMTYEIVAYFAEARFSSLLELEQRVRVSGAVPRQIIFKNGRFLVSVFKGDRLPDLKDVEPVGVPPDGYELIRRFGDRLVDTTPWAGSDPRISE